MAARTGASVGVAVAITILGILAFAFFVTTMVFFSKAADAQQRATASAEAAKDFIRPAEREMEVVRQIRQRAERERQSVVAFMIADNRKLMQGVAGDPDATSDDVLALLGAGGEGAEVGSLTGLLEARNDQIKILEGDLASAIEARDNAIARADSEAERVQALADEFASAGNELSGRVADYADNIEATGADYERLATRLREDLEGQRADADDIRRNLNGRISEMLQQNLVLQDQIRRLRGEGSSDRVRPIDEESLADAVIDRVDDVVHEVILSVGRNQKIILGMTFAVYESPTDIRIDSATGEYASGKGTVEVIRVEDNFSRARIITESRGNPIGRGDVIANAVYDPLKTYKFLVFGLFDRNGDGVKTAYERNDVAALVNRWGGQVVDAVDGNLDFLVLGEKPTLPPAPGPGAVSSEIDQYVRLQRIIQQYDTFLETARSTSVPVLNENRLRTLIGDYPD